MQVSVADPPAGFEVESLRAGNGRLEVRGRWQGVRGRRFVRPSLSALTAERPARVLADLEHKPWAPDGEQWVAVFPWSAPLPEGGELELAVAPDLAVALTVSRTPDPGTVVLATRPEDPAERAAARPGPSIHTPDPFAGPARPVDPRREERERRDAALADRERAFEEREVAQVEREAVLVLREATLEESEAALRDQAVILRKRDELIARRHELVTERDAALAERDAAVRERDAMQVRHDQATAARAAAEQRREAMIAQLERDRRAEHEHLTARDALERELADATAARAEHERQLAELRTELARVHAELAHDREALTTERAEQAQLRAVAQLASRSPRPRRTVRSLAGSVDWSSRLLAISALIVLGVLVLAIVGSR